MKKIKFRWTFDSLVLSTCSKMGWFGQKLGNYYVKHGLFQRFIKFGVSSFLIYWIVRAPMLIIFEFMLSDFHIPIFPFVTLYVLVIPAYVMSAFLVGIILSIVGFVTAEGWIWKKKR